MHRRTRSPSPLLTPALGLAALAACADGTPVAPVAPTAPSAAREAAISSQSDVIPGQYVVVLRDAEGEATIGAEPTLAARGARAARAADRARDKARGVGAAVQHVYGAAVVGFAGGLTADAVARLRADPEVAYVEPDRVVTLSVTQSNPTWGLDRIDERALPLSASYTYTNTASGVRAYIIDSGILTGHQEFGGRASNVYDGFGGNGQDCNGHGTHVAGTVGGSTYGVAKAARLRGVRVFQCSGGSANSTIIAGIDWVAANHIKPAVANLSLGGGRSQATNDAVTRLANAGVFVAVAAGNENQDACNVSPASAPAVTTVASSTRSDAKSSFSNWGACVDLYAPGSSITSAWYTSTSATNTISGTSMATPHVAGVAALYKAAYGDASQGTIDAWLKNNATTNVITGNVGSTPNRLLFKAGL